MPQHKRQVAFLGPGQDSTIKDAIRDFMRCMREIDQNGGSNLGWTATICGSTKKRRWDVQSRIKHRHPLN